MSSSARYRKGDILSLNKCLTACPTFKNKVGHRPGGDILSVSVQPPAITDTHVLDSLQAVPLTFGIAEPQTRGTWHPQSKLSQYGGSYMERNTKEIKKKPALPKIMYSAHIK